jgi:hypothetical protein
VLEIFTRKLSQRKVLLGTPLLYNDLKPVVLNKMAPRIQLQPVIYKSFVQDMFGGLDEIRLCQEGVKTRENISWLRQELTR